MVGPMTHTLTITDHPGDGDEIVSLDGGTCYSPLDVLLVPSATNYGEDRTAMVDAVRDLIGPRDQLPADLRDDRRIAWVRDAGDGEGAWCLPTDLRERLYRESWTLLVVGGGRPLIRPPSAPATEDVPWWEAAGRRLAEPVNDEGEIVRVECESGGTPVLVLAEGEAVDPNPDGTVTVLADTDR